MKRMAAGIGRPKHFDSEENLTSAAYLRKRENSENEIRRVNVDFPVWMISALDEESERLGVSRQAIIKTWIGERLTELMQGVAQPEEHREAV